MWTSKIVCFVIIAFLLAGSVYGTEYYVSPTGSDFNNGETPATAWASIDHGDTSGQVSGGDIVNILPGTYSTANGFVLSANGSGTSPIVYRALGNEPVILDGVNAALEVLRIEGNYIEIYGLEVVNSYENGIVANSRGGVLVECYVHDCALSGILLNDEYELLSGNICVFNSGSGMRIEGFGDRTKIHGNVFCYNGAHGIWVTAAVSDARIFNNIICQNGSFGIEGNQTTVCGFNNVWGNSEGSYNYCHDSEGGLSVPPQFVDSANGRFDLKYTAAEIDAGLDVGLPFNGSAPDIGAIEKYNVYYVSPTGDDFADGLTESTAWQSIDNGDSLLLPGDTVYVLPGVYTDSVIITSSGEEDDLISYVGVRDSCLLDASGIFRGVDINAYHLRWSGIDVYGAASCNLYAFGIQLTVECCKFSGPSVGILVYGGSFTITNNVFTENAFAGIYVFNGVNHWVCSNTFFNNDTYDIFVGGAFNDRYIYNNVFVTDGRVDTAIYYNEWDGTSHCLFYGYDAPTLAGGEPTEGCLIGVDPLLIEPENGNFHLQQQSPAIDAGTDTTGLPYNGFAPDMGAYETGVPSVIEIIDAYDTLSADSSYQFEILAFDSLGYPTNPGPLVWSHSFLSGSISSTGLFTPGLIGTGNVVAEDVLNDIQDTSASVTVAAGELHELVIGPMRDTLPVDSTSQFILFGYDLRDNPVSEFGNLSWDVLNGIGSIDQTGLFTAEHVGHGFIRAVSDLGPSTMTDTIVVTVGVADVQASMLSIPPTELIPGESSGPILAIELTNSYITPVAIDSIRLEFVGEDPDGATPEELWSQVESASLYLEGDNQYQTLGPDDSLLASGTLSDGSIVMATPGLVVPGNGAYIRLTGAVNLNVATSKNGNTIALRVGSGSDIYTGGAVPVEGDYPITNDAAFTVSSFLTSMVTVNSIGTATIYQGQVHKPVLDFELPANGYADDDLGSVILVNTGTLANSGEVIDAKLWSDETGDGFSMDDVYLGSFAYASSYWVLDDISHTLSGTSNRLIVTIDVASGFLIEGGTINLEVPTKGVEYASGTDGPDDGPIANPYSFLLMPANRVTAVSIPSASSTITAGSSGGQILTFALYNGYSTSQTLRAIRFTNHSHTVSTSAYADEELGQASLHFDDDYDRVFDGDPAVASGYFTDGLLTLSTYDLVLPAESLCYFFTAVSLPDVEVIDSDSLRIDIDQESDIIFELIDGEAVNINGDMPLSSGAYLVIDGSIRSQYEVVDVVSSSLAPGDTSVTLFSFMPALNGDQYDTLTTLIFANAGTADDSDFDVLELWLDSNGDEVWQSDDAYVGQFSYGGSSWSIGSMQLETGPTPICLFVTGDVSAAATPGASFQGEIPLDGCQFVSCNDGPIDSPLTGEAEFVVSSSGLKISTVLLNSSYTVGQDIDVPATVVNLVGTPLDNVYCEFVAVNNPSDSIVVGPVSLMAGEGTDFIGAFTAAQAGTESWRINAFSSSPVDSSAVVYTENVNIDEIPSDVSVALLNSVPTAVSRGQSNVFPLSISFEHVDTSSAQSSLRLDSIRISVEDAYGQALPANSVFSRVAVATDNTHLVVESSIGSQTSVWLRFTEPVIVPPGQEQLLSLLVDIDSLASASNFVLSLEGQTDINIVDFNTLQPTPLSASVTFPMQTASCRIDDPSQQLAVAGVSSLSPLVNYGQEGVEALELSVRHPGAAGTSQIQLTSLSFELVDENLTPLDASELVDAVRVLRQQLIVGELVNPAPGATNLVVGFAAPPTISVDETELLYIQLDLKAAFSHDSFGVRITDSTAFTVRDLSSGSIVTAISDQELATGNVFPIVSSFAQLKNPAADPEICLASAVPEYVIGGAEEVELMEITAAYPVTDDHSSIRASQVIVRVLDSIGVLLNPNELFDQIGISVDGGMVTYNPFIELKDGFAVFHFGDEGILINPGDTAMIMLVADIENATPVDNFLLRLQNDCALTICDATDTTHYPTMIVPPVCPFNFPFKTSVSQVYLEAGRPAVSVDRPPVQLAFPGQISLPVLEFTFSYNSADLQGDLALSGLFCQTMKRTSSGTVPGQSASIFDAISLTIDGDTVATDSMISMDSILFRLTDELTISRNTSHTLRMECDISPSAPMGNYVLCLPDSAFCELIDKNLLTPIYPYLDGGDYPLLSAEISLANANLENSYTNYPNPFNPEDGEVTTIGFVLTGDARVDIDLYTITGKLVKRVTTDGFRAAGSHQEDTWDGRNDKGAGVLPGTYFCRLNVKYLSGGTESIKRKITVIR